MRKRIVTIVLAGACLFGATYGVASANPGPGNSNQCAPGQHDGSGGGHNPNVCPPDDK